MSLLLSLPEDLCREIFSDWLTLKDYGKLDVCVCTKKLRLVLLKLISVVICHCLDKHYSQGNFMWFTFDCSFVFLCDFYKWMLVREFPLSQIIVSSGTLPALKFLTSTAKLEIEKVMLVSVIADMQVLLDSLTSLKSLFVFCDCFVSLNAATMSYLRDFTGQFEGLNESQEKELGMMLSGCRNLARLHLTCRIDSSDLRVVALNNPNLIEVHLRLRQLSDADALLHSASRIAKIQILVDDLDATHAFVKRLFEFPLIGLKIGKFVANRGKSSDEIVYEGIATRRGFSFFNQSVETVKVFLSCASCLTYVFAFGSSTINEAIHAVLDHSANTLESVNISSVLSASTALQFLSGARMLKSVVLRVECSCDEMVDVLSGSPLEWENVDIRFCVTLPSLQFLDALLCLCPKIKYFNFHQVDSTEDCKTIQTFLEGWCEKAHVRGALKTISKKYLIGRGEIIVYDIDFM